MNALRPFIERPGASAAQRHLSHRYATLLALHDRCRASANAITRLPGIATALDTVRARMAALNDERKAA
ncbi:MAG: hypothetical protein J7500_15585 [Sphingomonas sp.]|uniref:hypothetical protein n=1 Tax=Sphingomonas sp. TaxID=28214 RepID=UPI001B0F8556|nr:hypothetical protein [Sphingomonas sp.]MBO9624129.1 hypothetical protein [Sphingomonas sp.]